MADLDRQAGAQGETSGTRRGTDWSGHDAYWRDNYGAREYTQADRAYEYYQPAYKYGHESAFFYGDRAWDQEVEDDLARGWEQARGDSDCTWPEVKEAVRDAYERTRELEGRARKGARGRAREERRARKGALGTAT